MAHQQRGGTGRLLHRNRADKIVERFSGVLTHVGFSIAVESEDDAEKMRRIIERVRAG
jgi:hydrogenase maturation factor